MKFESKTYERKCEELKIEEGYRTLRIILWPPFLERREIHWHGVLIYTETISDFPQTWDVRREFREDVIASLRDYSERHFSGLFPEGE